MEFISLLVDALRRERHNHCFDVSAFHCGCQWSENGGRQYESVWLAGIAAAVAAAATTHNDNIYGYKWYACYFACMCAMGVCA